jgi:hypothetical protein
MKTPYTKTDQYRETLMVLAHTRVQFDVFVRKHMLGERYRVVRVRELNDIRGYRPMLPMIMLPDWQMLDGGYEALNDWKRHGGTTLEMTEAQARGEAPLCWRDTDHDGNCPLCVRHGGCPWPAEHTQKAPRK